MGRRSFPAVAVLGLGLATTAQAQRTAFVNVSVVPMTDSVVLTRQTVIVEGERIARIGPADSVAVPPDAALIDGRGGYLMPGLFDMHAHLFREEDLALYIAHGVTGVQVLNAGPGELELLERVKRGTLAGPMLFPCKGPITSVTDSAAAAKVVATAVAQGFTCIKPYNEIDPTPHRVLHETARRRGVRTVEHIPRQVTWQQMLHARPSAIAHAEEFLYSPIESAAAVDSIVEGMRAGGIALVATLYNYDLISRQILELPELEARPELAFYSPVHRRAWSAPLNRYSHFRIEQLPAFRRRLQFQRDLVRRLSEAGVTILAGTDAGNTFALPGYALHAELAQLVHSGLSPYRALRSATSDAARFVDANAGTVAVGREASLVLVHGNPLADIANTTLIGGVMLRGRWRDRTELRALLDSTRASYALEAEYLAMADSTAVERALAWLEAAVARGRRPPSAVALNEHAYQLWRIEERDSAAAPVFEANARLHPRSWVALGSLAEWRLARGDTVAARALLKRALQESPGNPEIEELMAATSSRPNSVR